MPKKKRSDKMTLGKIFTVYSRLESLSFRHWIRPHDSVFIAYSAEIYTLAESGFQNWRIHMPDSLDTCGRKPNPQRIKCGLKFGGLSKVIELLKKKFIF